MSKRIQKFLIITFGIMLFCWGVCWLLSRNGITMERFPVLYGLYFAGILSPTIASYMTRNNEEDTLKGWLQGVFDVKHSFLSYALVFLTGVLFIVPQCLLSGYSEGAPLYMGFLLFPFMIFGGGLEEAGWRHVLQPELEKKYSFTLSSIIVSLIWWIWHLPLFFIAGTGQYGKNFFAFGVVILGFSFALAALKRVSNSTFLCILTHAFVNVLLEIYIIHEAFNGKIVTAIVLILFSYGLLVIDQKTSSLY